MPCGFLFLVHKHSLNFLYTYATSENAQSRIFYPWNDIMKATDWTVLHYLGIGYLLIYHVNPVHRKARIKYFFRRDKKRMT